MDDRQSSSSIFLPSNLRRTGEQIRNQTLLHEPQNPLNQFFIVEHFINPPATPASPPRSTQTHKDASTPHRAPSNIHPPLRIFVHIPHTAHTRYPARSAADSAAPCSVRSTSFITRAYCLREQTSSAVAPSLYSASYCLAFSGHGWDAATLKMSPAV